MIKDDQITIKNQCKRCSEYQNYYKQVCADCDSVFDAVIDMQDFVSKCSKTCIKMLDNRLK